MKRKATLALIFLLFFGHSAWANPKISMDAIRYIESKNCKYLVNKKFSDIHGCYQVREITIKDFMRRKKVVVTQDGFAEYKNNEAIARWYLTEELPRLFRAYGKEVTIDNILIGYNAGPSYVRRGVPFNKLPKQTRDYIIEYKEIVK